MTEQERELCEAAVTRVLVEQERVGKTEIWDADHWAASDRCLEQAEDAELAAVMAYLADHPDAGRADGKGDK